MAMWHTEASIFLVFRRQAAEEKEQERQASYKYLAHSPYLLNAVNQPPSYFARPDVAI